MMADTIELTMTLHHETDAAILVSDDGEEKNAVWLPKSQIEWTMKDHKTQTVVVDCPAWLAEEKGLV
jgi:hypothetical protein